MLRLPLQKLHLSTSFPSPLFKKLIPSSPKKHTPLLPLHHTPLQQRSLSNSSQHHPLLTNLALKESILKYFEQTPHPLNAAQFDCFKKIISHSTLITNNQKDFITIASNLLSLPKNTDHDAQILLKFLALLLKTYNIHILFLSTSSLSIKNKANFPHSSLKLFDLLPSLQKDFQNHSSPHSSITNPLSFAKTYLPTLTSSNPTISSPDLFWALIQFALSSPASLPTLKKHLPHTFDAFISAADQILTQKYPYIPLS